MNRKYFLFILQFLTSICIVSVGFASWTIVSGVSIEESGTISAEDVHTNEAYLQETSIDPFRYYDTGFVSGSGINAEIVTKAQLIYTYKLNVDNLKADLGDNKSTTIKFSLYHTSITDFFFIMNYMEKEHKDDDSESYNIDVYLDEAECTSVKISVTNNTSTVEINLSKEYLAAASAATIKIIYNFAVPSENFNFKTQVFDYISQSDFYFYHKLDVLFNE